ncbi:MAG: hypothetical protein R3346_00605 [Candidatus Spechtbacterales bacterium]|nr:hypothetical protein [Candidatus Spechtbacterales bacterium]
MLIVLHGKNTFRSRRKLLELIDVYRKKHEGGFSYERAQAENMTLNELSSIVQSASLFDNSKLVVLENLLNNKKLKKDVVEWESLPDIAKQKDNLLILFEESSVGKDKDYKDILKNASKTQEFKELSTRDSVKWFKSYFENQDKDIDISNINIVVSAAQGDMWRAYNDLEKIYAYNKGSKLSQKEISALKIGSEEAQIFPTIDDVFYGNIDKAIYKIQLHWKEDYFPQQFFHMLERQIKLIALIKEQKEKGVVQRAMAKNLSLHPFVVKKTYNLCDKYSWQKIENIYQRIESLEVKSKTGQLQPRLACELLSVAIAS